MAYEPTGPGGVNNSYGVRETTPSTKYSPNVRYDEEFTPKDNMIVTAKVNPVTGWVGISVDFWQPIPGETGVLFPQYAPGDCRRYGIFPDGKFLAGLTFNGTSAVTGAPAGTFTQAMIGMAMGGGLVTGSISAPIPQIIAVSTDGTGCTLSSAASGSGTAGVVVGTNWEADHSSKMAAFYASAVLPGVEAVFPAGIYVTQINFARSASSGMRLRFDNAVFCDLIHLIADDNYPTSGNALRNVVVRGQVTTYDRFGAIGLVDCDLSKLNVLCKSDASKHVRGIVGRGVHIYSGIVNTRMGEFVIEDCGAGAALNTDAAFSVDDAHSHDYSIRRIWVKDSAGHGVVLMGANVRVDNIRVDAWGYGSLDRQIPGTVSLAQSQELCGVWLRRCSGFSAGRVAISQGSGTRSNALYDLRHDDSYSSSWTLPARIAPRIEHLVCASITYRGISVGDRNNNSALFSELEIGKADLYAPVAISTGYQMLHVNANTTPATVGRNALRVGTLTVRGSTGNLNDILSVPANTAFTCDVIDTRRSGTGNAGRLATIVGSAAINTIMHQHLGGSSSPTQLTIGPSNDAPVRIGSIEMAGSGSQPQIIGVDLTSAQDVTIGALKMSAIRGAGALKMQGAVNCKIGISSITSSGGVGTGIILRGSSKCQIDGGTVTGFSTGISGQAVNGNTNCSARNLTVTGNTANTDLPAGQVVVDSTSSGVTL